MQAFIKKNKSFRKNYKNLELNYYINAAFNKNLILSNPVFIESPKISKIRNICLITGRSRAIVQKYKLSRLKFKEFAEMGSLPGIQKK
jgi:ribosomal protein S14